MSPPRSALWKHFIKLTKDTAKCKLCDKILKSSGNTSNLHAHLKQKHKTHSSENECDGMDRNKKLCAPVISLEEKLIEADQNVPLEVSVTIMFFLL